MATSFEIRFEPLFHPISMKPQPAGEEALANRITDLREFDRDTH